MATFLDDLSIYNAKAAAAITLAATTGDSGKANLMSSLKSTANDTSLTEEVRLNALTALINVGNLLDIPLPPYFPITTTFANTQTYTGLHNDLIGLDVEPYLHITTAEKSFYANKANLSDISFTNLLGAYTSNAGLTSAINAKQNALNGTGFVKASGGTITYDNSTYLTSISGIVAGGDLDGTYPNPTLRNTSVTGQALTGFNGSASTGTITGADTILSAFETLNANVDSLAASSGTITSVSFALPSSVFSYTAGPFNSGAANLSGAFINQNQNRFFAGPTSGGTGQPTFRAIVPGDFPASGATAGTYGSSSSIPVVQVDAYGRVTNISSVASASGGQVNTVDLSAPGIFSTATAGTTDVLLTLGLETQIANTVWAGPASGVDATPGFRSLVALDIPNIAISQVTNLQSELDSKMTFLLNDGEIWIGNASNAPTNQSLTGDVTMTRDGIVTIENEAVTFAKMQNITSGNLLGRWDASTPGVIQQISLSADFDLDSGTGILSLAVPVAPILNSKGGLITYRQSIGQQVQLTAVFDGNLLITDSAEDDGLKWVTAQGDIEVDGALDGTFNITAGAVTLAKMATLAANSFIGNNTGSSATPIALTVTQATAMLNQFTTSAKGLVPASGGVGATYYLNANGGWTVPAGGGGTTTNALTIGSGLSGTAGTFNGSAAVTVSLNLGNANTWTALQTFQSNIYLGEASGAAGSARFLGSTSGYVALQAAASPANQIYTLPTAYPASNTGYFLTSTTGGVLSWDVAGTGTVTTTGSPSSGNMAKFSGATSITNATSGTDYVAPGVITSSGLTMSTARLLGRTTASTGAIEEISVGSGLSLSAGTLSATSTMVYPGAGIPDSTGSAWGTSYGTSGANSVVLRDSSQNISVNNVNAGTTTTATSGQTIALTTASSFVQVATGTTSNIFFNLPDATTLPVGATFQFNNNTTSGSVSIRNFTVGTTVYTLPAGGAVQVILTSNSTSDGVWDAFVYVPKNVTWGTSTLTATGTDAIFKSLTSGVASATAGTLVLRNASNAFTQTIRGTNPGASIIYDLPTTAPTAGQVLSSSAPSAGVSTLSWATILGTGNVVGPASSTTGNFAVYADTTGTLLANPSVATLSSTGDAVFNSSVTVGVSTSTTGQLIFRNATTSATTTLLASTSQSANLIYTWPITAPTAGQILSSDVSGNLSWTAAGSGDMTLAGVQTVTGAKTFGSVGNVGKLILAGTTSGTTVLNSGAAAGSSVLTLPVATSTLACLGLAQTFTAAQTFQAAVTIGNVSYTSTSLSMAGTTRNLLSFPSNGNAVPTNQIGGNAGTRIIIAPSNNVANTDYAIGFSSTNDEMWFSSPGLNGKISFYGGATPTPVRLGWFASTVSSGNGLFLGESTTAGFLSMNSSTVNLIYFADGGAALPSITATRSLGSKIVIKQALANGSTDYAIGYNTSTFWCSVPTGGSFIWYGNATPALTLTSAGALTLAGAIVGIASQDVFNTTSTTVNFAGAATTLAIGNTATAAQTVNMFTASTGASTYNFATGATASATTKAINIGTGGAAGSTTNITFGTSTTTNLRFFGSANTSGKPTVSGSKVSGAALASLLTAMSNLGLITDSTTA